MSRTLLLISPYVRIQKYIYKGGDMSAAENLVGKAMV
jgi:hypothetical protein